MSLLEDAYQYWEAGEEDLARQTFHRSLGISIKTQEDYRLAATLSYALGEFERAQRILLKACRLFPEVPEFWQMAGLSQRQLSLLKEAEKSFRKALQIAPGWIDALNNLALTLEDSGRYEAAKAILEEGLENAPEDGDLHNLMGSVQLSLGNPTIAITHFRKASEIEPNFSPFRFNLATALLAEQHWQEGWTLYEARLDFKNKSIFPDCDAPLWTGEDLNNQKILIWNEQGYGDFFQFMRFIPLLQRQFPQATIILRCQPVLEKLLNIWGHVSEIVLMNDPIPPIDFHLPMMSLPQYCDMIEALSPQLQPYLTIPLPETPLLPPSQKHKIGLVWQGSPFHPDDHKRSLSPKHLRPLLKKVEAQFVSLNKEGNSRLRHPNLFDAKELLTDFLETARFISELDLVISVDTAVAHLAGAMGKPVWLMVDFAGDWRWPKKGTKARWYEGMRLFRQDKPGDWAGVIQKIISQLQEENRA